MKKKALVLVLAFCLIFCLAGCGEKSGDKAADSTATNKLIVGFDAEFPPFGFIADDGSYDGFDLAVAKEVCTRLGWEFQAIPIDWNSKDAELESGSINCIWNGFTYTGREDAYTWSDVYYDNSIVIVTKADSGIASLADLKGKNVMAQAASSAVDAMNANEELKASCKVIEEANYNTGFMDLEMGTVDAIAADYGVATFQLSSREAGKYVILDEALSTEQYAVGFLLGNTELRDQVNKTILEVAADGTMLEIAQKYVEKGLVVDALCMTK